MKYDCHVFVCANQKPEGRKCCGEADGLEAVKFLREFLRNQTTTDRKIRVQRAGCLDLCSKGPAMVVYPEGTFYQFRSNEDLSEIAEQHLLQGAPVQNLMIADEL